MAQLPFEIDTEAKGLIYISGLLRDEIDIEEFYPSFAKAKWASIHIHVEGSVFNRTIPTSTMRGLVEFQAELYKSIALILYGDERASRLTDEDRDRYELIFNVSDGSTDLLADAAEFLGKLAERAVDKMTSKHIAIAMVSLGLLYFGHVGFDRYLSYRTDISKIEQQTHRDDKLFQLVQEDRQQSQSVISAAIKESESIARIAEQNTNAMDALVKAVQEGDGAIIQGRSLTKTDIKNLNESQRKSSEPVYITKLCKVSRVDAKNKTEIHVRFHPLDGSEPFRAFLSDPVLGAAFKSVIEKATFSNDTISVTFSARKLGESYVDAKIIKAYKPRGKRRD